jgi:hypothetical protein
MKEVRQERYSRLGLWKRKKNIWRFWNTPLFAKGDFAAYYSPHGERLIARCKAVSGGGFVKS